jgi:hypothetical protein
MDPIEGDDFIAVVLEYEVPEMAEGLPMVD